MDRKGIQSGLAGKKVYLKKLQIMVAVQHITEKNLSEAKKLRQQIYNDLEDKTIFAYSTNADFDKMMHDGFGLCCYHHKQMIGCIFCCTKNVEYALDMGYSEEIIAKSVDYEDSYVHPDYRGNDIQLQLEQEMETICRKKGKQFFIGTVAPTNQHSYENFLRAGYLPKKQMIKYGGLMRIFMVKGE